MLIGYPLLAGVLATIATLLLATTALGFFASSDTARGALGSENQTGHMITGFIILFIYYFVIYSIYNFMMTGLVGATLMRINGKDPVFRDGLRIASARVGLILGYSAVAATVGALLSLLRSRRGISEAAADLGGLAWNITTFLVIPIIAARDDLGPIEAIKESASLLKKTWGEQLVGSGGIGIVFFLLYMLVGGITAAALNSVSPSGVESSPEITILVIGTLVIVLIAALHATLTSIYRAMVYAYADSGSIYSAVDRELISDAFRPKEQF